MDKDIEVDKCALGVVWPGSAAVSPLPESEFIFNIPFCCLLLFLTHFCCLNDYYRNKKCKEERAVIGGVGASSFCSDVILWLIARMSSCC